VWRGGSPARQAAFRGRSCRPQTRRHRGLPRLILRLAPAFIPALVGVVLDAMIHASELPLADAGKRPGRRALASQWWRLAWPACAPESGVWERALIRGALSSSSSLRPVWTCSRVTNAGRETLGAFGRSQNPTERAGTAPDFGWGIRPGRGRPGMWGGRRRPGASGTRVRSTRRRAKPLPHPKSTRPSEPNARQDDVTDIFQARVL
jgi:hypothetical protein